MSGDSTRVKTCQTCATAKIRCLRTPGSAVCDRCLRLNKSCYFRPARLRQALTRKEGRLDSLERKVEELLGQSQENSSPRNNQVGDVVDRAVITLDEAAATLDSFLQFMMPHFPFVVLPRETTVGELRDQKPFLFLAILSVAVTDNHALQRALNKEVKAALTERTVLGYFPPSLETLQGILIVLAWSHHQSHQRSAPQDIWSYLHLAIGLIVDLEFDRPVELRKSSPRMTISKITPDTQPVPVLRAQQRAAIGCFVLSSCLGIIRQKTCIFPWSSHLEGFAAELSQNPEFASDQSLIHLVRLQCIFEQIDRIFTDPRFSKMSSLGPENDTDYFLQTFRAFQTQLQDYTTQLCPQWTDNNFLLASQLHTINLYLCQVTLFEKSFTPQLSSAFRVDILCHGLSASKGSSDTLLMIPLGMERCMSYTEWLQTGFNLILSCKLALMAVSDELLRHNNPRVQSLCDGLDMPHVLKTCIKRQLLSQPSRESQEARFDYVGWLQWIQEWFHRQYDSYMSRGKGAKEANVSSAVPPPVNHLSQPEPLSAGRFFNEELGFSESTHETLPWSPFPDFLPLDNILSGWMDLSTLSM